MQNFTCELTLAELIDCYRAFKQPRVTLARLKGCVNNLRWLLDESVLENWQQLPNHLGNRLQEYKASTRRFKIGIVRDFLRYISTFHGFDPRAAAMLVSPPEEVPTPAVLSHEECRKVLISANRKSLDVRLLVVFCLYHGLRPGEARSIEARDISLDEKILRVRWRPGRRLKTRSSVRDIPIPTCVIPALVEALESKKEGLLLPFSRWWTRSHKLPCGATPTLMRHTYASALVSGRFRDEDGEECLTPYRPDYWQVSRWMGHSNVNTLRYYAGLSDGIPALNPGELTERGL